MLKRSKTISNYYKLYEYDRSENIIPFIRSKRKIYRYKQISHQKHLINFNIKKKV